MACLKYINKQLNPVDGMPKYINKQLNPVDGMPKIYK
jgi:hypothetical protein